MSDEVVQEKFVCDLHKCKGGCCEDGDAGAPLEKEEKQIIDEVYEIVKPYLTQAGIQAIERQGKYQYDREFGWVTPTVHGAICAYGYRDGQGVVKCAFEQAYNDGKISWKKPISCHLFPIRLSKSREYIMANYEPRPDLCKAACSLGKKLKVPVYQFLKEPLIRKFGVEFYNALHEIATHHFEAQEK